MRVSNFSRIQIGIDETENMFEEFEDDLQNSLPLFFLGLFSPKKTLFLGFSARSAEFFLGFFGVFLGVLQFFEISRFFFATKFCVPQFEPVFHRKV